MSTPVLFVDIAKVATRLQVNLELAGVSDVLASAALGAQLHVEAALDTYLLNREQDCVFFTDVDAFSGMQPGGVFKLELPDYFIREDEQVQITKSSRWDMIAEIPVLGGFKVNHESGLVYLDSMEHGDCYIRVRCQTGFKPAVLGPDGEIVVAVEAIPDWLEEGIVAYVSTLMEPSHKPDAATSNQMERATRQSSSVINPHIRKRGFCFRPVV